MATTFLEPGGDADFLIGTTNGFWGGTAVTPSIVTDFVHGSHIKSIKYRPATGDAVFTPNNTIADSGTRISMYIYIVALPSGVKGNFFSLRDSSQSVVSVNMDITSGGVLQLWNTNTAQIGTDGVTLSTGIWYRISLAYTITSTTVNRFELFVDGVSSISITNATITNTGSVSLRIGNLLGADAAFDLRSSDHYIDNSSTLTDPGNIWVTAKLPFSNGTTNGFTTQIGSGGSGYGSGHTPQVNERALSTTNGWSMIGAGSAVTEEYTVEGRSVGDMNITANTLVDWAAWISSGATVGELASIITGSTTSTYQCGTVTRLVTAYKGSTTYPVGGTDVGVLTTTALSTLSLFEAGVLIAFLGPPNSGSITATPISNLLNLGVG